MDGQTPRKKSLKRRLARVVFVLFVLGLIGTAALPWLASTPPARNAIVNAINKAIAPSKVEIQGIRLAWTGALHLSGLKLSNREGKTLIDARQAVLNRGLIALARNHSDLGILTVESAAVDIERKADGSIDLVDALTPPNPIPAPAPEAKPAAASRPIDVTLRIVRGSLTLRSPELAEPLVAEQMDMEVDMPAEPGKRLSWKIRLARPPGGTLEQTLGIDGDFDERAAADPGLSVAVKGVNWPIAVQSGGVTARGRLDGALLAAREAGKWTTSGHANFLDLDASGPALSGDRLTQDKVNVAWEIAQNGENWSITRMGLSAPVATLSATGTIASNGLVVSPDARLDGKIDLAALSKQVPHMLHLRDGLSLDQGSARVVVAAKSGAGTQSLSVQASLSDLIAKDAVKKTSFALRDPATLDARASRSGNVAKLETLVVKSSFLDLNGSGDLAQGVKLSGSMDLSAIEAQLKDLVDFGKLSLAGKGRMAADFRKSNALFVARFATQITGLKVAGLTTEPIARESVRFDASASGPADEAGVPKSWDNLRVNLKSSLDDVALAAQVKDAVTRASLIGSVPVTLSGREGRADARILGRWRRKPGREAGYGLFEFDELRLGLKPADPALAKAGDGCLAIAAKGWLDLDAEDVGLDPIPLAAGAITPVVLSAQGLRLHGFANTPEDQRSGRLLLTGDVGALEETLEVWNVRPSSGFAGAFSLVLGVSPAEGGQHNLALNVTIPDLSSPRSDGKGRQPEGPLSLIVGGKYASASDRLSFDVLRVGTRYGTLTSSGQLDDPMGKRLADLSGILAPDWNMLGMTARLALEPKADLTGGTRPFHLKGALSGDSLVTILKGLDAEVGVDLTSADAFGLTLGPAPIVVRFKAGKATIDPVQTTLNNGKVDLKPGLTLDEKTGIALTFAPGSSMKDVEINDTVSRRVLTYVAPVLDKATNVNGKVDLTLNNASIPLTGPETQKINMNGQLQFVDVVFAPGPLALDLLKLTGQANAPGIQLHEPVDLSIANGRVVQKGLKIPIDKGAVLAMEGSVGFDETLDMKASVPVGQGLLGGTGANTNVVIPIGGTVSNPRIDKRALEVALRDLSRSVLKRDGASLLKQVIPGGGGTGSNPADMKRELQGLGNSLLKGLGNKP